MARGQVVRIGSLNYIADSMEAAVEAFLNYCRSRNLSPQTLTYYQGRLLLFQRYLNTNAPGTSPNTVTPELIRAFVTEVAQSHSATTASHEVTAIRALFNYLVRDGFLEVNPMDRVQQVKRRKTVINTFSPEQVDAILRTCGKTFADVRDRAILLTMLDCGLRVTELCTLMLDDVSWNQQTMLVLGKGDKERVVPFGQSVKQALLQYITRRGNLDTKALFVTCYAKPLDRYRVREIVIERCKQAGITGVRCSPHTFRHTFAVMYLRAGGDVFSLQAILGHSDLTMTRKYVELSRMDVVEKHRLYSPADRLQSTKRTEVMKRLK